MAELMEHVRELAEDIGPRPVSTEEEHRASLYVADQLEDLGLKVDVDEFATPTGVKWPFAISFLCIAVGTIISGFGKFMPALSTTMFALGLLLLIVSLVIFFTERLDRPLLSKLLVRGVSQNVVARYVPSSVARERRRRKVIIVAHVDTVRAEPEAAPFIINSFPLIKKIIYWMMIGLAIVFVIRMLPLPWPAGIDFALWILSIIASICLLICAAAIVVRRFMPFVSGANDNASSLAVMIELARRLLDPEERERYRMETYVAEDEENPVETLLEDGTPVIHGALEAEAAGVVPEGAALEYVEGEPGEDFIMPTIDSPDQVLSEMEPMPEVPNVFSTANFEPVPVADPAAVHDMLEVTTAAAEPAPVAAAAPAAEPVPAAMPVPEPVVAAEPAPEPVVAVEPEPEPAVEAPILEAIPEPEPEPEEDNSGLPSWYTAAKKKASRESDPGETGQMSRSRYADMPVAGRVITADELMPGAEPEPEPEPEPVHSFENESAAEVLADALAAAHVAAPAPAEAVAAPAPEPEPVVAAEPEPEPVVYAEPIIAPSLAPEPEPEPAAFAQPAAAPAPASEPEPAFVMPEPAAAPAPEPAPVEPEFITFDFSDDELGDLDPGVTGAFTGDGEPIAVRPAGLTDVIPTIGSSSGSGHFKPVAEPEFADESDLVDESAFADEPAEEKSSFASRIASSLSSLSSGGAKPQSRRAPVEDPDGFVRRSPAATAGTAAEGEGRRVYRSKGKPKARKLDDSFEATRAARRHDQASDMLTHSRQAAAVSSVFEDTPQGGPQNTQSFDPFAPKGDPAANASLLNSQVTEQFPAVRADVDAPRAGVTGSFPSLTGSFPSLTGSMPQVNAADFADDPFGDSKADGGNFDMFSPDVTSEINMPTSRFHDAMDNAKDGMGGLFGKFGRKKKDAGDLLDADSDDDYGWKGGGYIDGEEGEDYIPESYVDEELSPGKAARRRAAQIRESVVSMTEEDLLDKEVWFVALGASNGGNRGMRNFLDLHSSELRGSLIINLEAVGCGDICFVDYEGASKPLRSDRRLQSLVRKASKEIDGNEMAAERLGWRDTDATPAIKAGLRAMTIMGFEGVAPAGWHWSTDTVDIIEDEKMEYVIRLLLKMVENS